MPPETQPSASSAPHDHAAGDASLLAHLRRGDDAAFEALVRTHGPRLLGVARRLLPDEENARDAVQETFLSALKSLGSFKGGTKVSTWLHRIIVNAALMRLRSRRRKPEKPIDELLPAFLEDGRHAVHPPEWRENADILLERRETRDFIRACIHQLPESYRTVLVLRDVEELDTEETARILGLTENVVKLRLHRARQALRSLLEPRFLRGAA